MYCKVAKKIIEQQGHESIQYKTEDGWCPTVLYYHIASCDECNTTIDNNSPIAEQTWKGRKERVRYSG